MSVPQIPPRPARSNHPPVAPFTAADVPKIPPRPERRRFSERSQSPNRELFARSPLNEPPLDMSLASRSGGVYGNSSQNASSSNLDLPQRPPSVSLPSIGQEGNEYADIDYATEDPESGQEAGGNEPQETRNIGSDLPLHAPKPSFSDSTAKRRVSAVTRTDSSQAAAAGIGKASTPADDKDPHDRVLKPKVSFRTGSSASTERPASSQAEDDHGIPEIGQRVPMYPDAGDVQAPSPSPFQQNFPVGIGFHNAGTPKPSRHHRRTPSGREVLPPGSYGMHGHGLPSSDHFEKSWYDKHPEALEREEGGQYGPGISSDRGEWALSSDDLNKLVRETSRPGTEPPGLPNEQVGYMAYEGNTDPSIPASSYRLMQSNHSQPHVESPLRKASFPVDENREYGLERKQSHTSSRFSSENALDSETEDDDDRTSNSKAMGTQLSRNAFDGLEEERGYGVPILAADEVARTPFTEFQQPAVSPAPSRRGSAFYAGGDGESIHQRSGSRSGSVSNSRPTSRPGSIYGSITSLPGLSRFSTHDDDRENMHTPLEDVDEYEPLFSDEEGNKEHRPVTAAQRLKLREQMKRFPSRDIWEDTPNSLQLQATVQTPEPAQQQADANQNAPSKVFETPEQEGARKGEVSEYEKAKLVPREERLAKSHFKPHLREEMHRPGMSQRFPSKDIWEDSPDSVYLETTVGELPSQDPRSPKDEGLEAGAVVKTSGAPNEGIISGGQSRDNATTGAAAMKPSIPPRPNKSKVLPESADLGMHPQPSVPARPPKRLHQVPPAGAQVPIAPSKLSEISPVGGMLSSPTEARKGPVLPDRKSHIPTRPAKHAERAPAEGVTLSESTSAPPAGSEGTSEQGQDVKSVPPAPKSKPAIPARPAGGKIASLKAGFLSDLDSRLKLGPQGPKPQDKAVEPATEEEKAPLEDARKSRARGPARRKPVVAAGSTPTEDQSSKGATRNWQIQQPWTVWQHDGDLKVGSGSPIALSKNAMDSNDLSKAASAPPTEESHDAEIKGEEQIAVDVPPAKTAPQESSLSTEPGPKEHASIPTTLDLPEPGEELAKNPLSQEPSPAPPSPSTVIAPEEPTNAQIQTGEKEIKVSPGAAGEEKVTAVVGGDAQEQDAGGEAVAVKE